MSDYERIVEELERLLDALQFELELQHVEDQLLWLEALCV